MRGPSMEMHQPC